MWAWASELSSLGKDFSKCISVLLNRSLCKYASEQISSHWCSGSKFLKQKSSCNFNSSHLYLRKQQKEAWDTYVTMEFLSLNESASNWESFTKKKTLRNSEENNKLKLIKEIICTYFGQAFCSCAHMFGFCFPDTWNKLTKMTMNLKPSFFDLFCCRCFSSAHQHTAA